MSRFPILFNLQNSLLTPLYNDCRMLYVITIYNLKTNLYENYGANNIYNYGRILFLAFVKKRRAFGNISSENRTYWRHGSLRRNKARWCGRVSVLSPITNGDESYFSCFEFTRKNSIEVLLIGHFPSES